MSQAEFGALAYEVMRTVFEIRNEFGRLFDERIYKRELAYRFPGVLLEVPVEVVHGAFRKLYFLDVLVNEGALFEFKTVEALTPRHEAQLLHYLLLTELEHGKLVNLRPETIEQLFVNTTLRLSDRVGFGVETHGWDPQLRGAARFHDVLLSLLQDWGIGLDLSLYEDGLLHFLGGGTEAIREVEVGSADHVLGQQKVRLAAPGVAFKVTTLQDNVDPFGTHLACFLAHTNLEALLWANIGRKTVTFKLLRQRLKGERQKSQNRSARP